MAAEKNQSDHSRSRSRTRPDPSKNAVVLPPEQLNDAKVHRGEADASSKKSEETGQQNVPISAVTMLIAAAFPHASSNPPSEDVPPKVPLSQGPRYSNPAERDGARSRAILLSGLKYPSYEVTEIYQKIFPDFIVVGTDEDGNHKERRLVPYHKLVEASQINFDEAELAYLVPTKRTEFTTFFGRLAATKRNNVSSEHMSADQENSHAALSATLDDFQRTISSQAAFLTATDYEVLAAEAARRATANKIVAELKTSDNRPTLYRDRGEIDGRRPHLTEFLRIEWLAKGWKPKEILRQIMAEYDPDLALAISQYESRTALLPETLRFQKVRARTNANEREPS